jgi:hypothetical protein
MNYDEKFYYNIPENKERMYDLILRNLLIEKNNHTYTVDIGIKRTKKFDINKKRFYYISSIEEIGDLSTYYAWEIYNLDGFLLEPLKYYTYKNAATPSNTAMAELLRNGYGFIVGELPSDHSAYTELPVNIAKSYKSQVEPAIGEPANFRLSNEENEYYILINGFIVSGNDLDCLPDLSDKIKNALVYD